MVSQQLSLEDAASLLAALMNFRANAVFAALLGGETTFVNGKSHRGRAKYSCKKTCASVAIREATFFSMNAFATVAVLKWPVPCLCNSMFSGCGCIDHFKPSILYDETGIQLLLKQKTMLTRKCAFIEKPVRSCTNILYSNSVMMR